MKLETLRRWFESHKRTKLFVATPEWAVTGFAARPRVGAATDEGELALDLAPYVAWFRRGDSLVRGREPFGPVRLGPDALVTRRLQTHRRHLAGAGVPERYFEEAAALETG